MLHLHACMAPSGFPPRNTWDQYREYEVGELVLVTGATIHPRFHNQLGRVLRYHTASGVYAVWVERLRKELVLHKTEMRFANDHAAVYGPAAL
jgi:hypothetical protein